MLGYPPGGGTDTMARVLAAKLTEAFGQQVIVDNRPGANANLAADIAARTPPDGYTVLMISTSHAINKPLYRTLKYDLEKDFAPVIRFAVVPHAVVTHPSLPVNSVRELIGLAMARPGQLTFASSGVGASDQIAAEMFGVMTGTRLVHVPYKGAGPAMTDLVGGQVVLFFASMPAALVHIQSGRIRCIAVTSERRAAVLPDIPTVAEAGVPGYALSTWFAMLIPAGAPKDVIARLNGEINKIILLPDVKERLATVGAEPLGGTPEAFAVYLKSEIAKYAKIIHDTNIQVE
jgi:tripartite-type tricarboxylate transporter receptor subunit TctC